MLIDAHAHIYEYLRPYGPLGEGRAIGKDDAYVSRIIRFTLLAPDIIHAVLAGKINKSISTEKLKQALPPMWEDQKKIFDIE